MPGSEYVLCEIFHRKYLAAIILLGDGCIMLLLQNVEVIGSIIQ